MLCCTGGRNRIHRKFASLESLFFNVGIDNWKNILCVK